MNTPIELIVGLGNPGNEYEDTRHNAGAWFIETIAEDSNTNLRTETKFKGLYGKAYIDGHDCHLLLPTTFMNLSGEAVQAIARFYKINPKNILVVHDELDLDPGDVKLKFDGGHGGHNGLRSIVSHLNTKGFHRLRLGIGHPGNSKDVVDYVLKRPSKHDQQLIVQAIDDAIRILPDVLTGNIQKAMKALHTK